MCKRDWEGLGEKNGVGWFESSSGRSAFVGEDTIKEAKGVGFWQGHEDNILGKGVMHKRITKKSFMKRDNKNRRLLRLLVSTREDQDSEEGVVTRGVRTEN